MYKPQKAKVYHDISQKMLHNTKTLITINYMINNFNIYIYKVNIQLEKDVSDNNKEKIDRVFK